MQSESIVQLHGITKRFPGVIANDDISLDIKRGEIFAILGENGAGKSTLMSILYGLYEPDEGEIFIRGEKASIKSPNDAVAHDIGMVHQHFQLVEDYTVTENIILGMEPMKKTFGLFPLVDLGLSNQRVEALSKSYQLAVDPTAYVRDLKVYTRQRVEILKMLYREAEILIFDEPTAVLTPQEIQALLEIIERLRASGKTILLITHKLEEVKQIADRCAILNRGKLVGVYDVATTSTRDMARMMVGRDVVTDIAKTAPSFGPLVLQVQNLQVKDQEQFPLVKNVSFNVRAGEIFAIAGVAGNGQTELAEAITGLIKVDSGQIHLLGRDITHASVRERQETGMAYIPEDRQAEGLVLDLDLTDNLALKRFHYEPFVEGVFLRDDVSHEYADRLINDYDIRTSEGPDTRVRQMSGGNQQKAILAREIEENRDLILFVQPTRGLDVGAISFAHTRILEERARGKAILLISLELDEVLQLADTIGIMYNGELLKVVPREEMTAEEVGEYMMGVKRS